MKGFVENKDGSNRQATTEEMEDAERRKNEIEKIEFEIKYTRYR